MCTIMGMTGQKLSMKEFADHFEETVSRGPDMTKIVDVGSCRLGFQRLAIMDMSEDGMQPFYLDGSAVVCNGEIYGWREEKKALEQKGYTFTSGSDCEILLPMYKEYGTGMFEKLDSEFAVMIYDADSDELIVARDPLGIRPLYYGEDEFGEMMFASEPKDLMGLCREIKPFPPSHYWIGSIRDGVTTGEFHRYIDVTTVASEDFVPSQQAPQLQVPGEYTQAEIDEVCAQIRQLLIDSIEERLDADAPLGFLLSGGLDSSLVCAVSAKLLGRKIRTFAIGMDKDPIDLKYAREAAEFIGADHTEFYMTREDVLAALPEVIRALGTWDITTIRASMGMYLCAKHIHEETDVRVLMTGEISDELFGYKYTDFAPSAAEFQKESKKRIDEIHQYDVLRADRCIATHSMEGRVPFGDTDFVKYVMSIDPAMKMNTYDMGKYLLRHAFEKDEILPESILWRQKAAFSDAVGHSLADGIKAYAEEKYSDAEFLKKAGQYDYCRPFTKESLLYREIFEEFYPGQAPMIKDFWMPNKEWDGCDVDDPSARALSNYGASGM